MRCNIYNLRMSKGFGSTRKLAKVCDMTHSEICRLENNDVRNPSIVTCHKIARALDVTIDELFTFDDHALKFEGEKDVVVNFKEYKKTKKSFTDKDASNAYSRYLSDSQKYMVTRMILSLAGENPIPKEE